MHYAQRSVAKQPVCKRVHERRKRQSMEAFTSIIDGTGTSDCCNHSTNPLTLFRCVKPFQTTSIVSRSSGTFSQSSHRRWTLFLGGTNRRCGGKAVPNAIVFGALFSAFTSFIRCVLVTASLPAPGQFLVLATSAGTTGVSWINTCLGKQAMKNSGAIKRGS